MKEAFQAKAGEALELLSRCLHSSDDRIALMAAQAILDRGYSKPVQSIDANLTNEPIRFAELPMKSESNEAWLKDVGTPVIDSLAGAADDEQKH